MNNVTLYMKDKATGKEVSRTIDAINAMSSGSYCWELPGHENMQRENLESWIKERGNEQHRMDLELLQWTFSFKKGFFS